MENGMKIILEVLAKETSKTLGLGNSCTLVLGCLCQLLAPRETGQKLVLTG